MTENSNEQEAPGTRASSPPLVRGWLVVLAIVTVLTCAALELVRVRRSQPVRPPEATSSPARATTAHAPPPIQGDGPVSGPFAGYQIERRRVTTIAASWRVPAIALSSRAGDGVTWIGVQQPQGGRRPFIQVGTTDARWDGLDHYSAFWSDTAHRFRLLSLFDVLQHDRISASLTLRRGRWRVRIADLTSHQHREFDTAQEAGAALQQGEWLQEDPATAPGFDVRTHLPYARTGPVAFADLQVNGFRPGLQQLVPTWMALPGVDLEPRAVARDGFTIVARPSSDPPRVAALNPPPVFTSGAREAPTPGTWSATGKVIYADAHSVDPPGAALRRVWYIGHECTPASGCGYTVSRPSTPSGGSLISTALVPTPWGWRASWPALEIRCGGTPSSPLSWPVQQVWLLRFRDGGRAGQARESSFSYAPGCGFARAAVSWRARLIATPDR